MGIMNGDITAPEPSESSPDSPTPDTTTAAPAATTPGVSGTESADSQGPIPFARHKEILENARREAESRYSWANGLDAERGKAMLEWYQRAGQDPLAFVQQLSDELAAHPTYGPQFKSYAARVLGQRSQQGAADPTQPPQPDLVTEQGKPVYSAAQLQKWQDWNEARLEEKISQRFGPIEEEREQRQLLAHAQRGATEQYQQLVQLPHFKELQGDIYQLMQAYPNLDVRDAYVHAFTTKVVPHQQAQVIGQLKAKAQASTLNPSQGSAAQSSRPKDFYEAFERLGRR